MQRFSWTKIAILSGVCLCTEWALGQPVKLMPLGDSITQGDKSTNTNGYRSTLYNSCATAGIPVDFVGSLQDGNFPDKDHEGHGGWTSAQILDSIGNFLSTQNPQIVFLHIGTNDVATVDPSEIASNIESTVDLIRTFNPAIELHLAKLIHEQMKRMPLTIN
jgi:lysophospholipase L1-like esterase